MNYGGGSQEAKEARERAATRRREQQQAKEAAETYQRPTPAQADLFHVALLTPLSQPMLRDLPEPDPVPAGLYPKAYLLSQFNSEVGPGGYPCVDFNQPLLWYRINLIPPSGHPWAGDDWDKMAALFEADFDRIYRADTSRLELYAAGRKALATNSAGELLRPEAVEEHRVVLLHQPFL